MKKPRRGEVDKFVVEVRGIRDCCAIAERCGAPRLAAAPGKRSRVYSGSDPKRGSIPMHGPQI